MEGLGGHDASISPIILAYRCTRQRVWSFLIAFSRQLRKAGTGIKEAKQAIENIILHVLPVNCETFCEGYMREERGEEDWVGKD